MKFEKTKTSYQIPLDESFDVIDIEHIDHELLMVDGALHYVLDKIEGVQETEYNGHFGNYVFLSIDNKYDNKKTHNKIEQAINDFKAPYSKNEKDKIWLYHVDTYNSNDVDASIEAFSNDNDMDIEYIEKDKNEFALSQSGRRTTDVYKYQVEKNEIRFYFFGDL